MGFIKYSISLIILALFTVSLITFAVNFGVDNNTNINLGDDDSYNKINTELKNNISDFYTETETASEAFAESTISTQTDGSEGGTQFKVTPWTSLAMAKSSIQAGWNRIFGKDSDFALILTSIIAILGFIMINYAWKAWKGNPD